MATNAGIEVTQLRPQAQARDNYVRPERQNSGIQQALNKLSGTMHKKQTAEAKARAEEISIQEAITSADQLHNFEAYAQESPAVIAHLKELRGRAFATHWKTQTQEDYNNWKANSSEDGADFTTFMGERKQQLADMLKGDRFMTAGALGVINEVEHNMRASHRGYLDQRIRQETADNMQVSLQSYIQGVDSGQISIEQAAQQADDVVQTAHDTGAIHRSKGNEMMFTTAIAMYKSTQDPRYRLLAERMKYAWSGKQGVVNRADAAVAFEEADAYVERQNEITEEKQRQTDARISKEREDEALTDLNALLSEDANAEVDMGHFTSLGLSASLIQTTRKNFQEAAANKTVASTDQTLEKDTLLGDIMASRFNPNGVALTRKQVVQMVADKTIHTSHMKELMQAIAVAENATPLLHNVSVKQVRSDAINRIRNSVPAAAQSSKFANKMYDLGRAFDHEFMAIAERYYTANTDGRTPGPEELTQWAEEAIGRVNASKQVQQDTEELENFNTAMQNIDKAAKASSQAAGYHFPMHEVPMNNIIASDPRYGSLERVLKRNPNQIVKLNGVEQEAWKHFDAIPQLGDGAFSAWWGRNREGFGEQ